MSDRRIEPLHARSQGYMLTLSLLASSLLTLVPSASLTLGRTRRSQGSVPHRLWASSNPLSSPGTPTLRPPKREAQGLPRYIVSFAPLGAVSRKSMATCAAEPGAGDGSRTTMNPPPPMPEENMLSVPMHSAAATAASTAVPSSLRTEI